MLYRPAPLRLLPRYRRLMRDGLLAQAVIVESSAWYGTAGAVSINSKVKLHVRFDDGSGAHVTRVMRNRDLGYEESVGTIVPMRYEADDRSYIEVDVPEVLRQRDARRAEVERQAIREAERKLRNRQDG